MNCSNCGSQNTEDSQFCARCGIKLLTDSEQNSGLEPTPVDSEHSQPNPTSPKDSDRQSNFSPLNIVQLVAQTLAIYIASFKLIIRIVLIAQIPFLISPFVPDNTVFVLALTLIGLFTGLLASAATAYIVAQYCLQRQTKLLTCYVAVMDNGISLLVNALIFATVLFVGFLLSLAIIGLPLLIFVAVAWFFYIQAVVIEKKGPFEALARSWHLVQGQWFRVFGRVLVLVLILIVAGFITSLPGLAMIPSNIPLGNLLLTLGGTLVTPITYIGATLVYFDLRVRKEGFTLETLESEMR